MTLILKTEMRLYIFLKKLWKFIKALFLKDTLKTLNICNKRRFGISLSSGEKS